MNIVFNHYQPVESGYYLMKCDENSNTHLVLLLMQSGERPQILTENNKQLLYKDFPIHFYWSEIIKFSL